MIAVLLAMKLAPNRNHYAPMDEASLAHNFLLSKIGIFPVDIATPRGARQFLKTSRLKSQSKTASSGSPPRAVSPTSASSPSPSNPASQF